MLQVALHGRRGGTALIDEVDAGFVRGRRWYLAKTGYAMDCNGATLHRALLGLEPGDGRYVDHINGDRLDNRRANLRTVTPQENAQNRRGAYRVNRRTSRFRGVSLDRRANLSKRWIAQATLDGRNHFLGRFATEQEAAEAAAVFRREHMPYSEENTPSI